MTASGPARSRRTSARPGRRKVGDQPASLGITGGGEPFSSIGAEERPGKRVAVAAMLLAVERQHARPDDLGRREPRVVDGEPAGVAHDLDAEVPPGDQPAIEHRDPGDWLGSRRRARSVVRPAIQLLERHGCSERGSHVAVAVTARRYVLPPGGGRGREAARLQEVGSAVGWHNGADERGHAAASTTAADMLQAARDAIEQHRWPEAFELFTRADDQGGLSGADLEGFALTAFFMAGPISRLEHQGARVQGVRGGGPAASGGVRRAGHRPEVRICRQAFDRIGVDTPGGADPRAGWRRLRLRLSRPRPERGSERDGRHRDGARARQKAVDIGTRADDADLKAYALIQPREPEDRDGRDRPMASR